MAKDRLVSFLFFLIVGHQYLVKHTLLVFAHATTIVLDLLFTVVAGEMERRHLTPHSFGSLLVEEGTNRDGGI
jgi:hypothetical protein